MTILIIYIFQNKKKITTTLKSSLSKMNSARTYHVRMPSNFFRQLCKMRKKFRRE